MSRRAVAEKRPNLPTQSSTLQKREGGVFKVVDNNLLRDGS